MASKKRRSKFEARVEVALLNLTGGKVEYEITAIPYTLESNYWPDFQVPYAIYVEAKGRFTGPDRRKMLAVKKAHPEKDIRLCFMRNNPLYKGSKTTYLQWAAKHGFKATVFPTLPVTKKELK